MFRIENSEGLYYAITGRRPDTSAIYSVTNQPIGSMAFDTREEAQAYLDEVLPYSIGKQFSAHEIESSRVMQVLFASD